MCIQTFCNGSTTCQIIWNCVQTICTVTSIWISMWFIHLIYKIIKLNIILFSHFWEFWQFYNTLTHMCRFVFLVCITIYENYFCMYVFGFLSSGTKHTIAEVYHIRQCCLSVFDYLWAIAIYYKSHCRDSHQRSKTELPVFSVCHKRKCF